MKKKILSVLIAFAMAVCLVPLMSVNASAATSEELTAENTASVKTLEDGVTYFITQDLTINANKTNKNGLVVASGATVTLSIPYGTTLTVYGKNGSGTTGGGAAILLPNGATLKIVGEGKLVAVGGNAGNGSTGGSGARSIANDDTSGHYKSEFGSNAVYFAGNGGVGGNGGGGAGAGIGTNGGSGGSGRGAGGDGWRDDEIYDYNRDGYSGSAGSSGSSASASGNLICAVTIDMTGVVGGLAGTAGGSGSRGSNGYDGDDGDARGIAGGAGGGGGGGGLAGAAVGTGGGGGGQGGGGGSAGYIFSGRYVGGGGGGGGRGAGTAYGGAYGSDSAIDKWDCTNTRVSSVTTHRSSASGGNGNLSSYGGGGQGASMTIVSKDGKNYKGTAGNGGNGGNSGAAATAYTANDDSGKYILTYTASVGESLHGSVELTPTRAFAGDTITATITPNEGYEVDTITVNGTEVTKIAENQYAFPLPAMESVVNVTYKKTPYNVDLFNGGNAIGGNYSVNMASATIGDTVTITAAPNLGYLVERVAVNGVAATNNGDGTYSFTMPAQGVSISVEFDIDLPAIASELQKLNDADDVLQAAIESGDSNLSDEITALSTAFTNLQNIVNSLDNGYATDAQLNALKTTLDEADATMSAAITALTTRVQNLEAGLAAANDKINTNTSDITALKSDVATLNTYKTQAQSAITALQTLTGTQGTDISELKVAVQNLEAEITAANAKINILENRIATLEGKVSSLEIAKQNLDAAVAALNAAITTKADTETFNQKVSELNTAIAVAEAVAKAYADEKDTVLKDQLTVAIATAKSEAATAAENLVNTAKAELQTAINSKADISTLNTKVSELNTAIAAVEAIAKLYTNTAVTTLNVAITTAKNEAVNAAKNLVDVAKAELQAAIDNKLDTATVNSAISNLQNAITALENAKDNYITADTALKAELEEKIAKAKHEAIDTAKGYIPYIGENGNWWVGDTDTGVKANADNNLSAGSNNVSEAEGVDTVTVVAISIAGVALLGNVLLAVLILKKKISLV